MEQRQEREREREREREKEMSRSAEFSYTLLKNRCIVVNRDTMAGKYF